MAKGGEAGRRREGGAAREAKALSWGAGGAIVGFTLLRLPSQPPNRAAVSTVTRRREKEVVRARLKRVDRVALGGCLVPRPALRLQDARRHRRAHRGGARPV